MREPGPTRLPLEYAAEITLDLLMMREECVNAARALVCQRPMNEKALDECARLDEGLAIAYNALQSALRAIRHSRALSEAGPEIK
jgi:hypothetical protein